MKQGPIILKVLHSLIFVTSLSLFWGFAVLKYWFESYLFRIPWSWKHQLPRVNRFKSTGYTSLEGVRYIRTGRHREVVRNK